MVDLFSNPDGADGQSQAVLAYLRYIGDIDESWDATLQRYTAKTIVYRWYNGREQGYVATMQNKLRRQINIVWFEHRNSDNIHAVKWLSDPSTKPPRLADIPEGVYVDKFDTSWHVPPGDAYGMAKRIHAELVSHWRAGAKAATGG